KVGQVLNRLPEPVLEIDRQRSVAAVELEPMAVIPFVDSQSGRVGLSTHYRQQAIRIQRAIELVSMDYQHPPAFGGAMDQFLSNRHRPQQRLHKVMTELVVITGEEDDAHAKTIQPRDLVDHSALGGAPIP